MLPGADLETVFADGKTFVLAYKKAGAKITVLADRWRDEAFGKRDASWLGAISLPEDLGFWSLYLQGQPQPFLAAQESQLLYRYYFLMGDLFQKQAKYRRAPPLWEIACFSQPNNLSIGPFALLMSAWAAPMDIRPDLPEHQPLARYLGIGTNTQDKVVRARCGSTMRLSPIRALPKRPCSASRRHDRRSRRIRAIRSAISSSTMPFASSTASRRATGTAICVPPSRIQDSSSGP